MTIILVTEHDSIIMRYGTNNMAERDLPPYQDKPPDDCIELIGDVHRCLRLHADMIAATQEPDTRPAIQLEELIHELSSDNVRENLAAATCWKECFWGYLKRTEP